MESLGYILTNQFIIIAVDTNFIISINELRYDADNVKKVHRLNDRLMISVTGEYGRMADIYAYILKLNELGHNKTFNDAVENLESVFRLSSTVDVEGMKALVQLTTRFTSPDGIVDSGAFLDHLSSSPDLQAILMDAFTLVQSGIKMPTTIHLFGLDMELARVRMGQYLVVGNHFKSMEMSPLFKDGITIGFSSSTRKSEEIRATEEWVLDNLKPLLYAGWETSAASTDKLIEASKRQLAHGLKAITPFHKMPNVVYYELSHRTGFTFEEPRTHLKMMDFNL
jgi:hypothetical protein